jgi:hypothetical protein
MPTQVLVRVRSDGALKEEAAAVLGRVELNGGGLRTPVLAGIPGAGESCIADRKARGRFAASICNVVF